MKLTILYIGRNPEITEVMHRLLNANTYWTGLTTCVDKDALNICTNQVVDLVLLGNGINDAEEQLLRANLTKLMPDIKIIQHYGGGSGLLYGEVLDATS